MPDENRVRVVFGVCLLAWSSEALRPSVLCGDACAFTPAVNGAFRSARSGDGRGAKEWEASKRG